MDQRLDGHRHSLSRISKEVTHNITNEDMGMSIVAQPMVGASEGFWQVLCCFQLIAIVWFLYRVNLQDTRENLSIYQALPIAVLWSSLGIVLIIFNKVLFMEEGFGFGFPYAIFLMWWHCLFGTISTNVLRFLKPHMIPAVTEHTLSLQTYFVNVFPVAGLQAASLGLGNTAYLFLSVAYIQMVKNTTSVFVYIFSIMLALERGTNPKALAVIMAVLGLVMTSIGELNFTLLGFALQMSGTLCEASRLALTGIIMSSKHAVRLDPMSALYYSAPTMLVFLTVPMYFRDFQHMTWSLLFDVKYVLLCNALLAFSLNMTSMFFIKTCGPTVYALTGVVKDIALILLTCAAFGHPLTSMQVFGFAFSMMGFQLYNKLKEDQAYLHKLLGWHSKEISNEGEEDEEVTKPLLGEKLTIRSDVGGEKADDDSQKALSKV